MRIGRHLATKILTCAVKWIAPQALRLLFSPAYIYTYVLLATATATGKTCGAGNQSGVFFGTSYLCTICTCLHLTCTVVQIGELDGKIREAVANLRRTSTRPIRGLFETCLRASLGIVFGVYFGAPHKPPRVPHEPPTPKVRSKQYHANKGFVWDWRCCCECPQVSRLDFLPFTDISQSSPARAYLSVKR